MTDKLNLGIELNELSLKKSGFDEHELEKILTSITNDGASFVVLPLNVKNEDFWWHWNEGYGSEITCFSVNPLVGIGLDIHSSLWRWSVILSMPRWLCLDFPMASFWGGEMEEKMRKISDFCRDGFLKQILWASYRGVYAVILPAPRIFLGKGNEKDINLANYVSSINRIFTGCLSTRIWIRLPLLVKCCSRETMENWFKESHSKKKNQTFEYEDAWRVWIKVRALINYNEACSTNEPLGIALELRRKDVDRLAESSVGDLELMLDRWLCEPVRVIVLDWRIFFRDTDACITMPNPIVEKFIMKGLRLQILFVIKYPAGVLYEMNNSIFIQKRFDNKSSEKEKPSSLLSQANGLVESGIPSIHSEGSQSSSLYSTRRVEIKRYFNLLKRFYAELPALSETEKFEAPLLDILQQPLQPLKDNLESEVYETFEKDPIKYIKYKDAIYLCLVDRLKSGKTKHVIAVVGAGRGPLVEAALLASIGADVCQNSVQIFAVEKNSNAVLILKQRVQKEAKWKNVSVIKGDMRTVNLIPEKVDILISELLGSFGDNELSPECIDGAQQSLSEILSDTVCIPSSYYSTIEPVCTPKLWETCYYNRMPQSYKGNENLALESTHVVRFQRVFFPATEHEKKCFQFYHPISQERLNQPNHNDRYTQMEFSFKIDSHFHGFAGYFHCNLYKDISLSISPCTRTQDLCSWFPVYIPIRKPIFVSRGTKIRAHFWRLSDGQRVWYEWTVSEPECLGIHNVNGNYQDMWK